MMDKIVVTAADIEKLLAWRDEHNDLVRSMPVSLREVEIQIVESGISIKCFRSDKKLKLYIDTQPEATPQEVAGQCWRNSKYDPPTEADADRLGRIIVWGAAVKHVDITYWENAIFHPVDVPFWMPLPVAPEEKADLHRANDR